MLFALLGVLGLVTVATHVPALPWEEADENALMVTAAALAESGSPAIVLDHPLRYASLQLVEGEGGALYAKYGIGYPLLAALAWKAGGVTAALWLNPLFYLAAVAAVFLLAARLAGTTAALVASLLFAVHPTTAFLAGLAFNYPAAWAFGLWALVAAWRWKDEGGTAWAVAAGALAGFAVTVRAPQALLVFPLAGLALARLRTSEAGPFLRNTLAATAAAALALLPAAWFQAAAFGSPWATGYALTGETVGVDGATFAANAALFPAHSLATGTLPVLLLGFLALVAGLVRREASASVLGLWALPPLLLGLAWYHRTGTPQMDLRFFVPVYAAMATALAVSLARLATSRGRTVAVALATLALSVVPVAYAAQLVAYRYEGLTRSRALFDAVAANAPDGSVLFVSDPVAAFLDASRRWSVVDLSGGAEAAAALSSLLESDEPRFAQARILQQRVALLEDPAAMTASAVQLAAATIEGGGRVFSIEGNHGATLRYALGDGLVPEARAKLPMLGERGTLYELVAAPD
jgi:4-amino-4-deoxy-L-arabinose transferase-like glycosyltransferase